MLMQFLIGCMPLQFEIVGTTAIMTGDLRSNAKRRLETLLQDYPNIEWIELLDCPGSLDDDAVFEAGRLLRQESINTRVPKDGEIFSGAVDFFIAGATREYFDGGIVGVHSWSDGRVEGHELPRNDSVHDLYLDFYKEMQIGEDFYWFTLESAPYDGIHEMTREELIQYQIIEE